MEPGDKEIKSELKALFKVLICSLTFEANKNGNNIYGTQFLSYCFEWVTAFNLLFDS